LIRQEFLLKVIFFDYFGNYVLTGNSAQRYFSDGFQTHTSPAIQAKAVFQAQTATGKLNAEIIPTPKE
jgi:hypothetical protein